MNSVVWHKKNLEKYKKQIGKLSKEEIYFTNEQAKELIETGQAEKLSKAFSAFIFKEADKLSVRDKDCNVNSPYLQDFFEDIYQEGQLYFWEGIKKLKEKYNNEHPNIVGYLMLYVKNRMLYFKQRYLSGVITMKKIYHYDDQKSNKDDQKSNKDEKLWASVKNFGNYDDLCSVNDNMESVIYKTHSNTINQDPQKLVMYEFVLDNIELFSFSEQQLEVFKYYYGPENLDTNEICELMGKTVDAIVSCRAVLNKKLRKHIDLIIENIELWD